MNVAHKFLPNYTYEDYCQWEGQWELIDGIPYAMSPMPIPIHQRVNGNLYANFEIALKKACKDCKSFLPLDWKINENTIVQPDLLVVCKNIEKKYLDFTPILVAEILSPSTAVKDRNIKKEIYLSQKVKYFLILDPLLKKLEICEMLNDSYSPVAISPNNFGFTLEDGCTANVNFEDIWD
jgi:Uma2 family endonuclease